MAAGAAPAAAVLPTHHAGSPARAAPGRCALVKIGGHLRHSLRDSGAYVAAGCPPPAPADPRPAAAPGRPGSCRPETRRGPDWHSRDSNDEFPVRTPLDLPPCRDRVTGAPISAHSAPRSGRARHSQLQAGSRRPSRRPAAENRVAVTGCGGGCDSARLPAQSAKVPVRSLPAESWPRRSRNPIMAPPALARTLRLRRSSLPTPPGAVRDRRRQSGELAQNARNWRAAISISRLWRPSRQWRTSHHGYSDHGAAFTPSNLLGRPARISRRIPWRVQKRRISSLLILSPRLARCPCNSRVRYAGAGCCNM